jgi:adhesin/invasin
VKTISLKKVSAVAVASLGFGLLSVVPAYATAATVGPIVTNQTMVRTDDVAYDEAYTLAATGDIATCATGLTSNTGAAFGLSATFSGNNRGEGSKIKVGYQENASASEVLISTVAGSATVTATQADITQLGTSVYLCYKNTTAGQAGLGTPTSGVYTVTSGGNDNTTSAPTVSLLMGRNAAPGLYTLYVSDVSEASVTYASSSLMLADMPKVVSFSNTVSETSAGARIGDGTATYDVKMKDAGGRESYLLGSERIRFSVSGGSGSGVTVTTPTLPTIGAGDLTTLSASRKYQLTTTAATASGTYTITGTPEGFGSTWSTTAGTATLQVTSAAAVSTAATKLEITSAGCNSSATALTLTCTSDSTAATLQTVAAVDTKAELVALATTVVAFNYLPTSQRAITVKATFPTTATGDARFKVKHSTVVGVTTNTEAIATIVAGPVVNTATYTFTADYANADQYAVIEIATANAGEGLEVAAIYGNPAAGSLTIGPDSADIRVNTAGTTVLTATITDQFGTVMSNQGATLTTSSGSRNASLSISAVTNTSGVATFDLKDAYTGTALTTDAVTITAVAGGTPSDTINIKYGTATPGAISLAVTQPGTPGTTATYDTTITTSTAPTVTVDDSPDSTSNNSDALDIADQIAITGTLVNASGAALQGEKITVTGTPGVFFKGNGTLGEVDMTVATRKATVDVYTNSSGQVSFQAAFTKSGTATVTLTIGTVTKAYSISVSAGTARNITLTNDGAAVTVSATDAWGNGVAKAVTLSASGIGRFTNGVAYNSLTLPSSGKAVYDVIGAGSAGTTTITAAMTADTTNTALANATYGFTAGNYTTTKDISVVSGQSDTQKLMTQIDALNAKIVALNALIAKIMKKLGVR